MKLKTSEVMASGENIYQFYRKDFKKTYDRMGSGEDRFKSDFTHILITTKALIRGK